MEGEEGKAPIIGDFYSHIDHLPNKTTLRERRVLRVPHEWSFLCNMESTINDMNGGGGGGMDGDGDGDE